MPAKYPLRVVFVGGRVMHSARDYNGRLITLCGARGVPDPDPPARTFCVRCATKPNPYDNRSYLPKETRA